MNNAVHFVELQYLRDFSIYVLYFDPASYRLESTLLLFRNSISVPYFFSAKELPSNHKHDLFR